MTTKIALVLDGLGLVAGSVLDFSDADRVPAGTAPLHGQHTEEILAQDLAMTQREIGALVDDKIVGVA